MGLVSNSPQATLGSTTKVDSSSAAASAGLGPNSSSALPSQAPADDISYSRASFGVAAVHIYRSRPCEVTHSRKKTLKCFSFWGPSLCLRRCALMIHDGLEAKLESLNPCRPKLWLQFRPCFTVFLRLCSLLCGGSV